MRVNKNVTESKKTLVTFGNFGNVWLLYADADADADLSPSLRSSVELAFQVALISSQSPPVTQSDFPADFPLLVRKPAFRFGRDIDGMDL